MLHQSIPMAVRVLFFLSLAVGFTAAAGPADGPAVAEKKVEAMVEKPSGIEGAWENTDAGAWRQVKLITATHFMWTAYDRETKLPKTSAGGTCKINGNAYTEHVEFGTNGLQHDLVDKDQELTVKIDGDTMVVTGTLSNGMKLREVWKRLK